METPAWKTEEDGAVIAGLWLEVWNHPTPRLIKFAELDFPLGRQSIVAGKSRDCQVFVEGDSKISSQHWRIDFCPDGLWVSDLASTNGTKVNGVPVSEPVRLRKGFRIKFGRSTVQVLGEDLRPTIEGATYTSWMCHAAETHGSARAAENAIHRGRSTISNAQKRRRAREHRQAGEPGTDGPGAVSSADVDVGHRS